MSEYLLLISLVNTKVNVTGWRLTHRHTYTPYTTQCQKKCNFNFEIQTRKSLERKKITCPRFLELGFEASQDDFQTFKIELFTPEGIKNNMEKQRGGAYGQDE